MLTRLDRIANQNHLQLIKAMLPHLPADRQKTFSVLIKMMELQNVVQFYSRNAESIRACDASGETSSDLLDILTDVRQHCEGEEQILIDQMLQAVSMIELYSIVAQQEGGEPNE